jgi:hypothetical protein
LIKLIQSLPGGRENPNMAKNIAIVALAACLLLAMVGLVNDAWHASIMRAAEWRVRTTGFELWRDACMHAASGDPSRQKWCTFAGKETIITAADANISDEDLQALATEIVLSKQKH